ncbi:MAG: M12 family metallo-peptidase [Ferruginibacter sp.]
MNKSIICLLCLVFCFPVFSSAQQFAGRQVEKKSATSLSTHFSSYNLFRINPAEIKQYIKSKSATPNFTLDLPGFANWTFSLQENNILTKDYSVTVAGKDGKTILQSPGCVTYSGTVQGQPRSSVALTLADDLIYGMVRIGSKEYFIEPIRYFAGKQDRQLYVLYEAADVKPDPSLTCGVTETKTKEQEYAGVSGITAGLNCVQSELVIASDASMFTRYGSASDVALHNIGVINNVIQDYVNDQFLNNIELVIVAQYISTDVANDPLTPAYTGTASGTVLSNFRAWGQAGNFGVSYDDAELWTTRNIDQDGAGGSSGIVGLAYLGAICTSNKYHILEDYGGSNPTGSALGLRILTAHEMGHNFNCQHDNPGDPYIMAPSVGTSTAWSPVSVAACNSYVAGVSCLAQCSTAGPPVADFSAVSFAICTGTALQLTDLTLHGPTTWAWTFPGGSPASSTDRNPSVTFATPGNKTITLNVSSSAGTSQVSKQVTVSASPAAAVCINTGVSTSNAGVKFFQLGSINKSSGGADEDGNIYEDFSCTDNTILLPGTTYNASANVGTSSPTNMFNLIQLFIDYNNDGDFTDPGENVYSSSSCYIGTINFSFSTPANPPVTGQMLRARLIAKDCVGGVNSCYNVTNGQVEDYGVLFTNNIILPITLVDIKATNHNNINLVEWTTSSESNSSDFEIERSFDGVTYGKAGTVEAAHFSNVSRSYSFPDDISHAGTHSRYYYRLKMTDADGKYRYSPVSVVDIAFTRNLEITVQPNPVGRGNTFQVYLNNIKAQKIELVNALGQKVYHKTGILFTGIQNITSSTAWASGEYIVIVYDGKKTYHYKILLQ